MRNWKLVLIVVFIVLFPLILNFILQFPPSFDVVGDSVVWLEFWPTYLSAAASFIMIFLTYKMLRQNQMQMNEMKAQRLEDGDHLLQLVNIFFVDPAFTPDSYPQSRFCGITRHSGHKHHIQELMEFIFNFQVWKYVKKIFFHPVLLLAIRSSEEVLLSAYQEADPPAPSSQPRPS